jgi:hypothetical protein
VIAFIATFRPYFDFICYLICRCCAKIGNFFDLCFRTLAHILFSGPDKAQKVFELGRGYVRYYCHNLPGSIYRIGSLCCTFTGTDSFAGFMFFLGIVNWSFDILSRTFNPPSLLLGRRGRPVCHG